MRDGAARAGVSPGQGGRPAPAEHVHRGHPLAAGELLRHGGGGAGGGRVRARGDARAPGPAAVLARGRPVLPRPREAARLPGPGQRLPHPRGGARLRRPPRHPRRLHPPGRRAQALARVRAGAGAAAQGPALVAGAGRSRRADRGLGSRGRRHALPAARLAARGDDLGGRVAAPDDRDAPADAPRGAAVGARELRGGRRRVPALADARRGAARRARGAARRPPRPRGAGPPPAAAFRGGPAADPA